MSPFVGVHRKRRGQSAFCRKCRSMASLVREWFCRPPSSRDGGRCSPPCSSFRSVESWACCDAPALLASARHCGPDTFHNLFHFVGSSLSKVGNLRSQPFPERKFIILRRRSQHTVLFGLLTGSWNCFCLNGSSRPDFVVEIGITGLSNPMFLYVARCWFRSRSLTAVTS